MNEHQIRTLVIDRLNFLVGRDLAKELTRLLENPDFVGGSFLPIAEETATEWAFKGREMSREIVTRSRYVTAWREES